MKRFQELNMIAGMNRMAMVEGVMVTPDVALKILDDTTVEEFFNLDLYTLCKKVQGLLV